MFYFITMYIHKSMILPCVPLNRVFGRSAILPHNVLFDIHIHSEVHDATMCAIQCSFWLFCLMMFLLITMNIHKSMMLPYMPFNVVFGHSAILPHEVLFDHHVHSQVYDATMHAIEHSDWNFCYSAS